MTSRTFCLLAAWLIGSSFGLPLGAQTPTSPAGEGALNNDSFVPTHKECAALLTAGDKVLLEARNASQDPRSARARAMDNWHQALQLLGPLGGQAHWVAGLDPGSPLAQLIPERASGLARLWLSVPEAVWVRLDGLLPEERDAWIARFGPLAEEQLARAPFDLVALKQIERAFPLTRAAAIACIRLADYELEAGRSIRAQAFVGRAERHLKYAPDRDGWAAHLDARRRPQKIEPTPQGNGNVDAPWTVRSFWRLENRRGRVAPGERWSLGLGARPGLVGWPDGSVTIQTPRSLMHVAFDASGGIRMGFPLREDLAPYATDGPILPISPQSAGGWPHVPAKMGSRLFLVVDRGRAGSSRFDLPIPPRGNHLLALDVIPGQPSVRAWQRSPRGWISPPADSPGGKPIQAAIVNDERMPGQWEWQPGPLVCDGTLWVIARSLLEVGSEDGAQEEFLFLVGLDPDTGEIRHKTPIQQASDLSDRDASSMSQSYSTGCAPIGIKAEQGQILVQTNQGLCGVFDASDGSPRYLFQTRRRAPREAGWPGSFRPQTFAGNWWAAPFDSDFGYALSTSWKDWPLHGLGALAIDARLALADWDAKGMTFLARRGPRQTLWTENGGGDRQFGMLLGQTEAFSGMAAVGPRGALVCTDRGLYWLNRKKEWLLEQRIALEDMGAGVGGDVYFVGSRAWVVGADTLWQLERR